MLLEAYLADVQQMQNINRDEISFGEKVGVRQESETQASKVLTNADVEQELRVFYTEDISISEIEEYLVQKIQAVYGDKLQNAGISDVRKFLDGKLEDFEGASSYSEIVEELEEVIEGAKVYKKAFDELDVEHDETDDLSLENNEKEFSPLLQGITGCKSPSEYSLAKIHASDEYLRSKSGPDIVKLTDKGINR